MEHVKKKKQRLTKDETPGGGDCCADSNKADAIPKQHTTTRINQNKVAIVMAAVAFVILLFNQIQLLGITSETSGKPIATGVGLVSASVAPTGAPKVYGEKLGIRYDDVSQNDQKKADAAISKLQKYDEQITLKGSDLDRYVKIASEISCEYCCGAKSIIVRKEDIEDINNQIEAALTAEKITKEQAAEYRQRYQQKAGDAACGCAHSFAMRGLAKYLITNHGSEFTDEEILEEMAKWKALFFPMQMASKAQVLKERGIEFTYANLGSNRYRDVEKGSSAANSGMVGGC